MRKVHSNNVQTGFPKHIDLFDRVGLGANRSDDGGSTIIFRRSILGVEAGKPLVPRPGIEVH